MFRKTCSEHRSFTHRLFFGHFILNDISAPTVFRMRISEQQLKRSREWMITFGEAEMNKRYNHSLMKRGVSPGLPRQPCPGEFQILKRSAHGYAGAISILIQQVIGSRLRFQLWSYSGNWMTWFLQKQAPS